MSTTPDWRQNAEDAQQILCDAGDLLQGVYESLKDDPRYAALAARVRGFCDQVHGCMVGGRPWRNVVAEEREACAQIAERWADLEFRDLRPGATGCAAAFNEGLACSATDGIAAAIRGREGRP